MSQILYVFPHPDDESFGPAPAMARQRREGHAAHVLTLTRGEATAQRHAYGYSKREMGAVRYEEMRGVARALDLSSLAVLDFPDGALDEVDALRLHDTLCAHVRRVEPAVLVTYAVHGISGHPDHLVTHAAVKHAFCALRAEGAAYLQRLAFFTLPKEDETGRRPVHLTGSPAEVIDCVVPFEEEDRARAEAALDCYATYQDVIEEHRPLEAVAGGVPFELFQEDFDPPLEDLFSGL